MAGTQLESIVKEFEQLWEQGVPPAISSYLHSELPNTERIKILIELIAIDIENRWQRDASKRIKRYSVEDYIREFPELSKSNSTLCELLSEEYRVRCRFDVSPQHAVYLNRFPALRSLLKVRLQEIDRELAIETDEEERILASQPKISGEFDPQAPLPYSDYQLRRLIGAGRMGKVYYAWQVSLDRPVAIKFLRKTLSCDRRAVERFLAEAKTIAKLQHPNIVGIHGIGRTPGGGYFLVMDWIDGSDLSTVSTADSIPIKEILEWMIQACRGVAAAHQRGIVHCDLKPANLLKDYDNRIFITDFGLAQSIADNSRTERGIEGTAPFMAPEQVSSYWGNIGPTTDVYGLGSILYTLITGTPPWTGKTLADVLAQVVSAIPVTSLDKTDSAVSQNVIEVCNRSLSKRPSDRFSSVDQFRSALENCLQNNRIAD